MSEDKAQLTGSAQAFPESTIDSANQRIRRKNASVTSTAQEIHNNGSVCESTIESSLRRDFIKKAAFAAAALGIGGTFVGNSLIRKSSASSNLCCTFSSCNIVAKKRLEVYPNAGGHCNDGTCVNPGFAILNLCGITNMYSGISSAGKCGSPNRFGLDFWAGDNAGSSIKHMSLTTTGKLGLGTDAPSSTLCVQGDINSTGFLLGSDLCVAKNSYFNRCSSNDGTSAIPGILFGCGSFTCAGIASARKACSPNSNGLDFYTCVSHKVMSITTGGRVGIGTVAPNTTLQVNGGISAHVATPGSGTYIMSSSDFAVLANASSGTVIIKLPPASTKGMITLVKKIDTSAHSVSVSGLGTDKIEGSSSKSLTKKYQSLTLIADGGSPGNWFIISNAT